MSRRRVISVTEWAGLNLWTAAMGLLFLAISLGVPAPSSALDTGTYKGTALNCVAVDDTGLFQRHTKLDAELEVTSSTATLLASGISVTGAAVLTLQGPGFGSLAVGLPYKGYVNITSSAAAEVVVQMESGGFSLLLTCQRSGPVELANRNKCQGTFGNVDLDDPSVVCPVVKIKNY